MPLTIEEEEKSLEIDPTKCPGCKQIMLACKCPGGGKKKKGDNEAEEEKAQEKTNSKANLQLTPFKLVLHPGNKKADKENLDNSEQYEIQEGKTPQDVLNLFHAHLRLLSTAQNKTLDDLAKQGFSGKIEGNAVVLTFPNANEREKFRQIAITAGLINQTLLNQNNPNSIAQQMVARITNPQNRREQFK